LKKENNKKAKESKFGKGCFTIFIIIIVICLIPGIYYYNAEKAYQKKSFNTLTQKEYILKIKNYKDFSSKEVEDLSIKLYLLNECEGGQKRVEEWKSEHQSTKSGICKFLLESNIRKENLPSFKTELDKLKYLNRVNFGKAFKIYKEAVINLN
tara:strand:+ start:111 stop:569 length:459 start_codon:yes stop_codon:yes gene_type:complete